jgi:hypothetical protein
MMLQRNQNQMNPNDALLNISETYLNAIVQRTKNLDIANNSASFMEENMFNKKKVETKQFETKQINNLNYYIIDKICYIKIKKNLGGELRYYKFGILDDNDNINVDNEYIMCYYLNSLYYFQTISKKVNHQNDKFGFVYTNKKPLSFYGYLHNDGSITNNKEEIDETYTKLPSLYPTSNLYADYLEDEDNMYNPASDGYKSDNYEEKDYPDSPVYQPTSPVYQPTSPAYQSTYAYQEDNIPTSPEFIATSPVYQPTSPVYQPTSPAYQSTYAYQEDNIPTSPEYIATSHAYQPTSPAYQEDNKQAFIPPTSQKGGGSKKDYEMEASFGTLKESKKLTRTDYNNVLKTLNQNNFEIIKNESTSLKILIEQNEQKRIEQKRIEINNLRLISSLCKKKGMLDETFLLEKDINILTKKPYIERNENNNNNGKFEFRRVPIAFFNDFDFKVRLSLEEPIKKNNNEMQVIINQYENSENTKTFRYMKRISWQNNNTDTFKAFQVDLSIVKQANSIKEVFETNEQIEIEIEVIEEKAKQKYLVGQSSLNHARNSLAADFKRLCQLVISAIQESCFPISKTEMQRVRNNYCSTILGDDCVKDKNHNNIYDSPLNFRGPSMVTLEMKNLMINSEVYLFNKNPANDYYDYCVTTKTDGLRCLLYIFDNKLYLINMNMNIKFTGVYIDQKNDTKKFLSNYEVCLFDGELVQKNNQQLFYIFDVYYLTKDKNVWQKNLINRKTEVTTFYNQITEIIPNNSNFQIKNKIGEEFKLFDNSKSFQEHMITFFEDTSQNHDTEDIDGLIFTPVYLGVGYLNENHGPKNKLKSTWDRLFKWKPTKPGNIFQKVFNTIDFLVITEKVRKNAKKDKIFQSFIDNVSSSSITCKKIYLYVGLSSKDNMIEDPYRALLTKSYLRLNNVEIKKNDLRAGHFNPEPNKGVLLIEVDENENMITEDSNEIFTDDMIVEFKYDDEKEKFIPLKVRYDKTYEYQNKKGIGANNYRTAISNWNSIKTPILETHFTSDFESIESTDSIYYKQNNRKTKTFNLRIFHNYIKSKLIKWITGKLSGNDKILLIDYACGKAGDLYKWKESNIHFVLGLDISSDNIKNKINGACMRYINDKLSSQNNFQKKSLNDFQAIFLEGDTSNRIKQTPGKTRFSNDNQVISYVDAIFGTNTNTDIRVEAVKDVVNIAEYGFHISSIQFAIHYMFENQTKFENFVQNVKDCTKINGYFVGTCFDGKKVFDKLQNGDIVYYHGENENQERIFEIKKLYTNLTFPNNNACLGMQIEVFQDSIGQDIKEYLVNFQYLTEKMNENGFELVEELYKHEDIIYSGIEDFEKFYDELDDKNTMKTSLSEEEKSISFLNKYFVFKKMQNVSSDLSTNNVKLGEEQNKRKNGKENKTRKRLKNDKGLYKDTSIPINLVEE